MTHPITCVWFCCMLCCYDSINSLAPGRFKVNFRWVIFRLILVVNGSGISCETAIIWVSLDHTYDKSTLVQVMAWCHQATSHYLSQCWPRSLSQYGVTRPQWVNSGWFIVLLSQCHWNKSRSIWVKSTYNIPKQSKTNANHVHNSCDALDFTVLHDTLLMPIILPSSQYADPHALLTQKFAHQCPLS